MEYKSKMNVREKPLEISPSSVSYLKETSSWALFFAVLGFVFIVILVLGAFFVGAILSALNGEEMLPGAELTIGIIYLIIGVIYFFPIYYLYMFSTNMKKAIENNDIENLDIAFKNIKSHYKFMGVFTIIILAIYILMSSQVYKVGCRKPS